MNANIVKICSAFLVLNALWFSRSGFNFLHFQPELLETLSPNGLFHLIPIPTTGWLFFVAVIFFYLSGLTFLLTFHKYALLVFFIAGSIVDNVHVNFAQGGHSRYLEYSLLLPGVLALFLHSGASIYLRSYRALIVAYYFIAGLYKFSAAGFAWGLDDSIFIHAVAVQVSTPVKEWLLGNYPDLFKLGAYAVFLAELFSPLMLFLRPFRIVIVVILFLFHLSFPLVWGGHRDFVVNCVGLVLCLSDEKFMTRIFKKYELCRQFILNSLFKFIGKSQAHRKNV